MGRQNLTSVRRWLASQLVVIARKIDPTSEKVMSFWMDRMTDFIIEGKSNIKITVIPESEMADDPKRPPS